MEPKLSGFRAFLEEAKPAAYHQGLADELGVDQDDYEKYYASNIIVLHNVKTPDGVWHSSLPVRIKPGSMTDTHVTVVRDTTFSPSLNDKTLRKGADGKPVKISEKPEEEEWTIPLALVNKQRKGSPWQSMVSQGWQSALQGGAGGAGGMDPLGGLPM